MHVLPGFLAVVIENGVIVEQSANSNPVLFAVICMIIGAFALAFPYASWYLSRGWQFRDAEPSDFALIATRIGGAIALVIGIIFLFL